MSRTTAERKQRGMFFSLDFSLSFVLVLVMVLLFAVFVFSFQARRASELAAFREKKNRVLFLDSLVKRAADSNQAGLAAFDFLKRRTLENRLGTLYLREELVPGEFGLAELWTECAIGGTVLFRGEERSEECEVLSRAVFGMAGKCMLYAKFCGG